MIKVVKKFFKVNRTVESANWGASMAQADMMAELAQKRLVVFGEIHSNKHVVALQTEI
jgi:hypothetical protein